MDFSGIIVPLVTPFDEHEKVDIGHLQEHLRWVLGSGVHGILVGGSMGEYPNLNEEEREKVFEIVCRTVPKGTVVMVNISDTSEKKVLQNIDRIRDLPVHAYVLTPPYYFLYQWSELEGFFFRIAEAARKPVFVYNIPEFVGNKLSAENVLSLSQHPQIVGVKDSSGDFVQLISVLLEKKDTFYVFQGCTEISLPSLIMGCNGLISGLSNVVPGWFVRLFSLVQEGKFSEAKSLQRDINRVNRVFIRYGFLASVKYALSVLRLYPSRLTLPFSEISMEGKLEVERVLKEYDIG